MSFRILISVLLLFLFTKVIDAQKQPIERMSLQTCVDMGLENNPAIKIVQNRESIARNNHSLQPFSPALRGTARQDFSQTESTQTFSSGEAGDFKNSKSEIFNSGIYFSWRLFDGLGMFATYERSKVILSLNEVQTRKSIENLVVDISYTYYQILVQNTRVDAAVKTLDLSHERFRIVEEKVNIGSSSGMDLHQARIDFNADSSYLVRQMELLMNSYIHLNRLMNLDFTQKSYVVDSIVLGSVLLLSDLELATLNNNTTLLASTLGIRQSKAELKQAMATRYPTINFVSGYSISRIDAPTEPIIFRESNAFNYGFEASFGIFNGFQINRNIKNASIELENRNLSYEDAKLEVLSELHTLYNAYVNNLMMVDFEKQNVEVSQTNLDLALERYELGALSGLGFREFQISYLNSVDRSLAAMYQAKVIELSLLVISGQMDEFVMRIK